MKFCVVEFFYYFFNKEEIVCFKVGMVFVIFVYNNILQQYVIKNVGGILLKVFEEFLGFGNEFYQVYVVFQIIVLVCVIDSDQVNLIV